MKNLSFFLLIFSLHLLPITAQGQIPTRSEQIVSLISKIEDDQIRMEQYRFSLASRVSNSLVNDVISRMLHERDEMRGALQLSYGISAGTIALFGTLANVMAAKANDTRKDSNRCSKTTRALAVLTIAGASAGALGLVTTLGLHSSGQFERWYLKTKDSAEFPKDVYDSVSLVAEMMSWDLTETALTRPRSESLNDFSFILTREIARRVNHSGERYVIDLLQILKRENLLTAFEDMNFQRTRRFLEGAKKATDFIGLTEKDALRKSEAKKALKSFESFLSHVKEVWAKNSSRWPKAESQVNDLLVQEEAAIKAARQSLGL